MILPLLTNHSRLRGLKSIYIQETVANGKTSLIWRWENTGEVFFFELGNLNRKDIDKLKIEDPFIKEIVEIWSDTFFERKIVSKDHFLSLPLLQNSLIRINKAPIFCNSWLNKGITKVKHLMDENSLNFFFPRPISEQIYISREIVTTTIPENTSAV